MSLAPSPTTMVFPLARAITREARWDNDSHRVSYNPTQHEARGKVVWEQCALAMPRVGPDANGVWTPLPVEPGPSRGWRRAGRARRTRRAGRWSCGAACAARPATS